MPARSIRRCGRAWATASTAATIAWRSAPGTSSRAPRPRPRYAARDDLRAPPLAELAALDDAGFRARFSGSPIKRIGRDRFVRNVAYAIGNSGAPRLRQVAQRLAGDADATVAEAGRWAAQRLNDAGGPIPGPGVT